MEALQNRIESGSLLKNIINYYEESKENINFKSQLILALIESLKDDNEQFFSKSKTISFLKYWI